MTLYYGRGVVDQLMDDLRMYGNAFAMVEWQGQDWPATKEEESRMKQIDFAKPLRGAADKKPVTVVQEGLTLVRHSVWHSLVDEQGRTHAIMMDEDNCVRLPGSNSGIENVPEPKSDHLHLYRREGEEWRIDFGSGQLFTKEQAEANSRVWARHSGAKNTVVVKVPV